MNKKWIQTKYLIGFTSHVENTNTKVLKLWTQSFMQSNIVYKKKQIKFCHCYYRMNATMNVSAK